MRGSVLSFASVDWISGSGATGVSISFITLVCFFNGYPGRNGGHVTTAVFEAFSAQAKLYGIEQAVRGYELEEYTARAIVKIIKERDLAVDLVHGGHATLFFTEEEERQSREDFRQAKEAGIDVTGVEWFTKETMQKVLALASYVVLLII